MCSVARVEPWGHQVAPLAQMRAEPSEQCLAEAQAKQRILASRRRLVRWWRVRAPRRPRPALTHWGLRFAGTDHPQASDWGPLTRKGLSITRAPLTHCPEPALCALPGWPPTTWGASEE